MTDSYERSEFESFQHRLLLKYVANSIIFVFAPAAIGTAFFWLWFRALLCWGGHPSDVQLFACRYAHMLPISVGALFLVASAGYIAIRVVVIGPEPRPIGPIVDDPTRSFIRFGVDHEGQARRELLVFEMSVLTFLTWSVIALFYLDDNPVGLWTLLALFPVYAFVRIYLRIRSGRRRAP